MSTLASRLPLFTQLPRREFGRRWIVEQLDNLSVKEIQAARAYEQQNKNRDTLLEQIDRRINAAS